MLKTPLGRFRVIGHIEAVSFLVLLCIAMPLKYLADLPVAVLIVGSIHGALFSALHSCDSECQCGESMANRASHGCVGSGRASLWPFRF